MECKTTKQIIKIMDTKGKVEISEMIRTLLKLSEEQYLNIVKYGFSEGKLENTTEADKLIKLMKKEICTTYKIDSKEDLIYAFISSIDFAIKNGVSIIRNKSYKDNNIKYTQIIYYTELVKAYLSLKLEKESNDAYVLKNTAQIEFLEVSRRYYSLYSSISTDKMFEYVIKNSIKS